jgi:hypothetical protein
MTIFFSVPDQFLPDLSASIIPSLEAPPAASIKSFTLLFSGRVYTPGGFYTSAYMGNNIFLFF